MRSDSLNIDSERTAIVSVLINLTTSSLFLVVPRLCPPHDVPYGVIYRRSFSVDDARLEVPIVNRSDSSGDSIGYHVLIDGRTEWIIKFWSLPDSGGWKYSTDVAGEAAS